MPTIATLDAPLPGSLEEAQQRYETTKKALKNNMSKKRQIDRTLTDLESQIFLFEGSYLTNTAASGGNIVKGFDSYLKTNNAVGLSSSKSTSINTIMLGSQDVAIEDRMFSLSSATYKRSLELKANEGRSREQSPVQTIRKEKDKDKDRGDSVQKDKEAAKLLKRKERESMGSTAGGEGKGSHKKKRKEED
jgi:chromatin modification-related protein EAF6